MRNSFNIKTRADIKPIAGRSLSDLLPEEAPQGISLLAMSAFRLSRLLKSSITRLVARDPEVSLVAWRVLIGLWMGSSATQKEISDFINVEQAQLSRVLNQMTARGLIASEPSRTDRRARVFSMTPKGRQKFAALLPVVSEFTEAVDASLDDEEKRQFVITCEKIARASQNAGLAAAHPETAAEKSIN